MKIPKIALAVVALTLAAGEALVQLSGIVDIPVYCADNTIGYIPAPNQSGNFLNLRKWQFNEHSMGTGAFEPDSQRFNVLLLGDSVVQGGNPLAQAERLGPRLESLTGWQVWSVSAGSWGLQNQMAYIRSHPEILNVVDAVAIVLNSGDFGGPSSWTSSLTHPLKRPFPGLLHVARKYGFSLGSPPEVRAELQVMPRDWRADLHDFSVSYRKPVFVFLFPRLDEFEDPEKMHRQLDSMVPELQKHSGGNVKTVRVAASPLWEKSFYRDAVHPSSEGNAVLAKILMNSMCESRTQKMTCPVLNDTTQLQ